MSCFIYTIDTENPIAECYKIICVFFAVTI